MEYSEDHEIGFHCNIKLKKLVITLFSKKKNLYHKYTYEILAMIITTLGRSYIKVPHLFVFEIGMVTH